MCILAFLHQRNKSLGILGQLAGASGQSAEARGVFAVSSLRANRRWGLAAALLLLVSLMVFGGVSAAWAGTIGYWTAGPTGDSLTNRAVIVSATSTNDGSPLVSSSLKLYIDGVLKPRSSYTGTVGATSLYVFYSPSPVLTDGTHTFRVEVSDAAGKLSSKQWTTRVVQPPSGTWLKPLANSTVYVGRPSIMLSLGDNTPNTTFSVTGQVRSGTSNGPIVATFGGTGLSAGENSFSLSSELVFGTYYLTSTVTDAAGNSKALTGSLARKFTTVSAPAMSVLEQCDGCHAPVRSDHVTPTSIACAVCHIDQNNDDHMEGTGYCEDCHWEDYHLDGGTAVSSQCASCHTASRPQIERHTAVSTSSAHDSSCGGCHYGTLITTHAATPNGSVYAYQCDMCHGSTDIAVQTAIATENTSCAACHIDGFHIDFDAKHEAPTSTCSGGACHSSTKLVDAHAAYVGPGGRYPQYADTCALCHQNADPDRVPEGATSDCASCHPDRVAYHGYDSAQHTAVNSAASFTILGADAGTHECAECHATSELLPLHESCDTCHPSPASSAMPWAKGCVQGGCHSIGSTRPQHSTVDSAHVTTPQGCTMTAGCHSGGTNVASIHQQQGCAACHTPGVTPTAQCSSCHDLGSPHGDDRATHASSIVSGDVTIFDNHDSVGGISYYLDCGLCHTSTNLLDVHGDCSTCHSGPRTTFTTWNRTCQQGSCHVTYHDEAVPGHEAEYNGDCESYCHNSDWSVPVENCGGCHTLLDSAPPVTYSNAQAAYTGPARITLSSYDPFPSSGVAATYYTIDGGAQAQGTVIDVAPPATGTANHTVSFWSVDNEGRIESAKSASFTISADSTPPSTSSDAEESYAGPATIAFSATDNGSRGIKATYYRLDDGEATIGTQVYVPQPTAGVESHTLEFWSVDWTDNEEEHQIVEFTNSVDSFAPVTTLSGVNPWNRFYRVWATLDAVDVGDAGVASSWVNIDGTNLYGGPSAGHLNTNSSALYLVEGMHTAEFWSVDAVGNTETHQVRSFGIDWHGPAITHNGMSQYTGPATIKATATDLVSGINPSGITYRVDGGAIQTGDTAVVPAPASGYVNHTVQFFATDVAGNAGSVTFTFRVNAGVDTSAPTGTMSVNSGAAYATAPAVTVNSAVTDPGAGVYQMAIDPGTGTYGAWTAYSAAAPITLPAGDGSKTVRVQYRDYSNNTLTLTDTIVLDTVAPAGTMTLNNGASSTNSTAITVNSAMADATSGLSQMRVDPGTGTYGAWVAYAADYGITIPGGNGVKTVNVQYRDAAGLTRILTAIITYITPPPDTIAPTTTSSVSSVYYGPANIQLTATDNAGGSGVAHTYYRLDGGAQTEGTTLLVPAPLSGSAAHELEFWSVDVATNVETPHNFASFSVSPAAVSGSQTFAFTGSNQLFTVPEGITSLEVDLYGAEGGFFDSVAGGLGGHVSAVVPVTPGQVLSIRVGGYPGDDAQTGGWPNGGNGGGSCGGPGGGSSSILAGSSVLVEAGGGGGGDHEGNNGGDGGSQGWLPGGNGAGGDGAGAGGGGGWNGGSGYAEHEGGGDGGTSYIAAGAGTLVPGVRLGHGEIRVAWTASDAAPPVTTSNAQASYTGPATITLTPSDAGTGVKTTYYKLDGGPQTVGTVVMVAAPAAGSQAHTLEFWSVDNADNVEDPHKTANFTVSAAVAQTGTIIFRWASPPDDAWADFYIDGASVGSLAMPDWQDDFAVTVPVRSEPYNLSSEWWDSWNFDDSEWSYDQAVIDEPGDVHIFTY